MIILVVQGERVVTGLNHPDRGLLPPIVASLLMDEISYLEEIYIAGVNLYTPLAKLNRAFAKVPGWKMRITDAKRRHPIPVKGKIAYRGTFFVDYFCLDDRLSNVRRLPRKRIDVINLDRYKRNVPTDPEQQLEMAVALIHLAHSRGIKLRPSNGSLGAALLKGMPSWEKGRHAAPHTANNFARSYLPGNHYSISSRVGEKIPFGYYLDQTGSHHAVVTSIRIPHPHFIRSRATASPLYWRVRTPFSFSFFLNSFLIFSSFCLIWIFSYYDRLLAFYLPD